MKTKVLIVEDHHMIRDVLKSYLDEDRFLVTEAVNGKEGLDIFLADSFDLVLTDIDMPEMDGMEMSQEIKNKNPDQKILVVTMILDSSHVKRMLKIGVSGYISKDAHEDEFLKAVEIVLNNEHYYSDDVTNVVMSTFTGDKQPKSKVVYEMTLSEREKEVLHLIIKEYSNKEIADKLFISVRTVDAHKRNLIEKTGVKNMAGLVIYALERNIFDDII